MPWPGALLTSTWPPACRMIPYTVARPSPVPLPTPLVVKNGSNTRARTSSLIPCPVSDTVSCTVCPARNSPVSVVIIAGTSSSEVSTTSVPPSGIASRALTARFSTTCSICPGSIRTGGRPGCSRETNVTCSPISRRSMRAAASTTSFRSTSLGCTMALRLKASSWPVSAAARCPASRMAWTDSPASLSVASWARRISA